MSDDIVERLVRQEHREECPADLDVNMRCECLRDEAADEIDHLRAVIATTRHTADHWRRWALEGSERYAAHALCMVLTALDGETDQEQLGIANTMPDDIPAWKDSR